jgi:hypothetical protein
MGVIINLNLLSEFRMKMALKKNIIENIKEMTKVVKMNMTYLTYP